MSHELSDAQKKAIADKKNAYIKAFQNGSVTTPDLADEYHNAALEAILGLHGTTIPPPPPECPPLPDDGRPQPSKGANNDPNTWKVVPMKDDPSLFKVVDNAGINVADQFDSQTTAQQYINHFKCDTPKPCPDGQKWDPVQKKCVPIPPPPPPCPPGQHRDASGNCVPDTPGGETGPYKGTGKELGHTIRGPTTRHYASGKPDDETIETNTKSIPYTNYQFVVYTTIHDVEHDDTLSLKFGGTHMGSGWFDCGVGFEDGECCLGVEKKHPSTDLCVVKGPKIGNILEKKIGVAGVYFNRGDTAHIELWTDFPAGSGWKKQVEGDNVANFNPKSDEDEAQQRIDGFVKGSVPTLHSAVVQEIP